MSKEEHDKTKQWIEESAGPAVVAGVSIVAGLAGLDPTSSILAGLVADRATAATLPGARRRWDAFTRRMFRPWEGVDDPTEEFWKRVKEREAGQEAWFAATARLRSLTDPEVAAALGALVRSYVEADRMPDTFFRDASGLFTEIRVAELEQLQPLLERFTKLIVETPFVRAETRRDGVGGLHLSFQAVSDGPGSRSYTHLLDPELGCTAVITDVMRLVARHGLGEGGNVSGSGLMYIQMTQETAARLLALL